MIFVFHHSGINLYNLILIFISVPSPITISSLFKILIGKLSGVTFNKLNGFAKNSKTDFLSFFTQVSTLISLILTL